MSLYSRLDRLAADVARLDRQLTSVSNHPQSQRTSVEGGSIDFNDDDGNLMAIVGSQDDGGNTINVISGPTPPTPVGFTVDVDHGKFIVHWSGDFDGDKLAPSDWSRAEVHASQDPFFVASRATARGSIVSAAGGEVTIGVLKGPWTIKMLAWSQAGKMSAPSSPVDVEVPGYGDIVLEEIDAAQTRIENARAILVDGQETLGGKLEEVDGSLTGLGQDVAAVEQAQQELEGSVSAAQQTADNAQQAAWDAESTATTAKNAADQATADAAVAAGIANGKGKVLVQSSAPGEADRNAETLWIDTTGGANTPKRWSGTAWVAVTDKTATDAAAAAVAAQSEADQAKTAADAAQQTADAAQSVASAAQTLATQAMASANSKNRITRSTSTPPTTYDGRVDDVWWVLSSLGSGGRVLSQWRWNGNVWVSELIDSAVLAYVDAAKITTGFLDVATLIRAGAITVDKILVGVPNNMVLDVVTKQGDARPHVRGDRAKQLGTQGPSSSGGIDPGRHLWAVGDERDDWGTLIELAGTDGTTLIPVEGGYTYSASMTVRLGGNYANGTGTCRLAYQEVGATGDSGPIVPLAGTEGGATWAWVERRANFKVGPGATHVRLLVQSTVNNGGLRVAFPKMQLAVGGTLIEPGGIQTPHLAADVLEVGNLKAGTAALAEAVIKKLFAEVVVARMAQAEEFIGENALLTNSVTAPKIVASEELWAKLGQFVKIRAEHIQSDALDFMVARGGTYLTSGGNGSWSDNGLFISGPDGTSLVRFPTDGTPLSLTASDVQIDRASIGELDTTQQTVRSSGTVTLASGVTAPASPPELTAAWQRDVVLNAPNPGLAYDWTGLARWGDKWVRGVNVLTAAGDDLDAIELYNPDGTLNKTIKIDLNPRAGVTVIGDIVYTIGPDHVARPGAERQWCHGFNLNTGARVSRWEFTRFTASGQKQFAVGTDGTNLLTAGVTPTPNLYVMKYNPATGAQIGGAPNPPSTGGDLIDFGWDLPARDLFGVRQSGNDLFVSHVGGTRIYTVSGTTITRKPDTNNSDGLAGFAHENRSCAGVAWVSGIPLVVDPQGRILEGSKFGSDATIQACVTWVNGSQETTPSLQATLNVPARATLSVSLPKRAGLQKNLYLKSSQYGGGWVKVTIPETTTSVVLDEVLAGLGQLPAQNTFPASTPAVLKSGNGGFEARGDGSGKWGPLTFGADGSMTGIRKPASGTLDITPTAANTPREVWVTFPVGRFTTPPTVVVSARSTVPGTRVTGVGSGGQTAAGFNAYLTRTDTTTTGFNWIAIEEG